MQQYVAHSIRCPVALILLYITIILLYITIILLYITLVSGGLLDCSLL